MKELSKKNEYWVSKHRFYELKHFCLQYHEWRNELNSIYGAKSPVIEFNTKGYISDTVFNQAARALKVKEHIELVEKVAKEHCDYLASYILKGVTEGIGYDSMYGVPCCRDVYYEYYRKFFYYLSLEQ